MKLVRDGIPQIIEEGGGTCKVRKVHGVDEHIIFLRAKMIEETNEFVSDPSYEEAADMIEVVKAFCHLNDLDWTTALRMAWLKAEERGGFYKGILLQKVDAE